MKSLCLDKMNIIISCNRIQVCSAGSRLLVQETVYSTFIDKLKMRMKTLRLGSSLDKALDMGAIIDPCQQKYISDYVEDARKEGAEVCIRLFVYEH